MIESAGLLMFRDSHELEIFLVHPGGPYWANQDKWGIPKGKVEDNEEILEAAIREFNEETGITVDSCFMIYIGTSKTSTKMIHAWAFRKDFQGVIVSNKAEIEYPAKSGKKIFIDEVDEGRYFSIEEAKTKIHKSQLPLLESFLKVYNENGGNHEKENEN